MRVQARQSPRGNLSRNGTFACGRSAAQPHARDDLDREASPEASESAGLLQQTYAADPSAPAGRASMLFGDTNPAIVLQPLADSRPLRGEDKRRPAAELIVVVALRLKSTAG
jgi:hypothetical protein